jgi:hypothetical protein
MNQAIRNHTMSTTISRFLAATILAATAFAHGGFEHVLGTVSKVSAQSATVTTAAKKNVDVGLNAKTTYTKGDKAATAADMKVGDRVVIDATEVNEALTAVSVKIGVAAKATK